MIRKMLTAGAILVAGVAVAQPPAKPDPIAQARIAQDLADQKVAGQVTDAIRDAEKMAKASPTKAIEMLKQEMLAVDLAVGITSDKRTALVKQIQGKIENLKSNPGAVAEVSGNALAASKDARKKQAEAMSLEGKEVNAAVEEVSRLNAEGKSGQALAKAHEIALKYPNNPATIFLTDRGNMAENIAAAKAMTKMQSDRVLYVYNEVSRAALPVKGDIEFPADWKEKTKRRTEGEKLTPEMESLLQSLDKPVNIPLAGLSLGEAIQTLSNSMDKPIAIEEKSLQELDIDLKKPASFDPGKKVLTARTVLRGLLQTQQLTYVVKDNLIQVMTLEKARTMLTTKAYYLGDIVQGIGPLNGGAIRWGPFLDYQQTQSNVQYLIDAIKVSVDPYVWKGEAGGPATITFHYPSMSLVVRAPAEVHATLAKSKLGGK